MKTLAIVGSLALATGVFAQHVTRNFGSVVFPGGTSGTTPGVTRSFGSAVFPGGSSVPTVRGGALPVNPIVPLNPHGSVRGNGQGVYRPGGGGRNGRSQPYVYAYPVYVGGSYTGGYDSGYYGPQDQMAGLQAPPPQAPPANVTVVFPPNQRANPVMVQAGPDGEYYTSGQRQGAVIYEAPRATAAMPDPAEPATDNNRYLIAFKDHTIYSAVAYWADGDTLHYFTSGSTHNQASVSLIDRDLTERLNKEMGTDFKLPPAK